MSTSEPETVAPHAARVTYLIASYKLPDQLLRLASVLRGGSAAASLVVHHDDRHSNIDRRALGELGVRFVEPQAAVEWGEISQLAAVLRSLRWCLDHTHFDWLVLLSGQDYPIRPLGEVERSFADAPFDGLIEARRCERPGLRTPPDEFSGRYYYCWRRTHSRSLAALARAAAGRGAVLRTRSMPSGRWIGVRRRRTPFGPNLICHRGSDWFSLSRNAVQTVDEFVRRRPDTLRYYRRTIIPTESFVQTVLANDPLLRLSGDPRRYTVWDEPNQTGPRILRLDDLDAILTSGCDFARKFDETVDHAVLDEIDRRVHSR